MLDHAARLRSARPARKRREAGGLRGQADQPRLSRRGPAVGIAGASVSEAVCGVCVLAAPALAAPGARRDQLSHESKHAGTHGHMMSGQGGLVS